MTDTPKRAYGPADPSTTDATSMYTVPGATTFILRELHISNPTGSAATITISIGTTATAANRMWDAFSVPAGNTLDWSGFIVLTAAETLQFKQGTASALIVVANGVEVT